MPAEIQGQYNSVVDFREEFVVPRWRQPWPFRWRYGVEKQYDQVLRWVSQQREIRSLEFYIGLEGIYSTEFRCTSGQGIR